MSAYDDAIRAGGTPVEDSMSDYDRALAQGGKPYDPGILSRMGETAAGLWDQARGAVDSVLSAKTKAEVPVDNIVAPKTPSGIDMQPPQGMDPFQADVDAHRYLLAKENGHPTDRIEKELIGRGWKIQKPAPPMQPQITDTSPAPGPAGMAKTVASFPAVPEDEIRMDLPHPEAAIRKAGPPPELPEPDPFGIVPGLPGLRPSGEKSPELSAKATDIMTLSRMTGLPPHIVSKNFDQVAKEVGARGTPTLNEMAAFMMVPAIAAGAMTNPWMTAAYLTGFEGVKEGESLLTQKIQGTPVKFRAGKEFKDLAGELSPAYTTAADALEVALPGFAVGAGFRGVKAIVGPERLYKSEFKVRPMEEVLKAEIDAGRLSPQAAAQVQVAMDTSFDQFGVASQERNVLGAILGADLERYFLARRAGKTQLGPGPGPEPTPGLRPGPPPPQGPPEIPPPGGPPATSMLERYPLKEGVDYSREVPGPRMLNEAPGVGIWNQATSPGRPGVVIRPGQKIKGKPGQVWVAPPSDLPPPPPSAGPPDAISPEPGSQVPSAAPAVTEAPTAPGTLEFYQGEVAKLPGPPVTVKMWDTGTSRGTVPMFEQGQYDKGGVGNFFLKPGESVEQAFSRKKAEMEGTPAPAIATEPPPGRIETPKVPETGEIPPASTPRFIVTNEKMMKGSWKIVDTQDPKNAIQTGRSKSVLQSAADQMNKEGRAPGISGSVPTPGEKFAKVRKEKATPKAKAMDQTPIARVRKGGGIKWNEAIAGEVRKFASQKEGGRKAFALQVLMRRQDKNPKGFAKAMSWDKWVQTFQEDGTLPEGAGIEDLFNLLQENKPGKGAGKTVEEVAPNEKQLEEIAAREKKAAEEAAELQKELDEERAAIAEADAMDQEAPGDLRSWENMKAKDLEIQEGGGADHGKWFVVADSAEVADFKTEAEAKGYIEKIRKDEEAAKTAGASPEQTKEIANDFKGDIDFEGITRIFDSPKKSEIFRTQEKAKRYVDEKGWMSPEEAKAELEKWKANAKKQGKDRVNGGKVVLSLFDLTGEWARPWHEAGYDVFTFDIQNDPSEDIKKFGVEYFGNEWGDFGDKVYAVLSANPCTDFAVSGARHFAVKDAKGQTIESVELVHQTLRTVEYFRPSVWALENPVGRIEKLTGLPPWRLAFDPNHFGEPYTKKTLIWGRFNGDLPIAPVEPTEGSKMWSKYGGKSQATKNARAETPEGFAYAFFQANNFHDNQKMAVSNKYDLMDPGIIEKALDAGMTEEDIGSVVDDMFYDQDIKGANEALLDAIKSGGKPEITFPGDKQKKPGKAKQTEEMFPIGSQVLAWDGEKMAVGTVEAISKVKGDLGPRVDGLDSQVGDVWVKMPPGSKLPKGSVDHAVYQSGELRKPREKPDAPPKQDFGIGDEVQFFTTGKSALQEGWKYGIVQGIDTKTGKVLIKAHSNIAFPIRLVKRPMDAVRPPEVPGIAAEDQARVDEQFRKAEEKLKAQQEKKPIFPGEKSEQQPFQLEKQEAPKGEPFKLIKNKEGWKEGDSVLVKDENMIGSKTRPGTIVSPPGETNMATVEMKDGTIRGVHAFQLVRETSKEAPKGEEIDDLKYEGPRFVVHESGPQKKGFFRILDTTEGTTKQVGPDKGILQVIADRLNRLNAEEAPKAKEEAVETIVTAAVRNPKTGLIATGPLHVDLYKKVGMDLLDPNIYEASGFMTSKGRFVGEDEASKIAQDAKQIAPRNSATGEQITEYNHNNGLPIEERLIPPPSEAPKGQPFKLDTEEAPVAEAPLKPEMAGEQDELFPGERSKYRAPEKGPPAPLPEDGLFAPKPKVESPVENVMGVEKLEIDLKRKGAGWVNDTDYKVTTYDYNNTETPSIERTVKGERETIVGFNGERFTSRDQAISWAVSDARTRAASTGAKEKSKGHLEFIGNDEFYVREDGRLYRATVSSPVMTDGYRSGRFEHEKRPDFNSVLEIHRSIERRRKNEGGSATLDFLLAPFTLSKEIVKGFSKALLPSAVSPKHLWAAEALGHRLGKFHRAGEWWNALTKKESKMFVKMGVHNKRIPLEKNPGVKLMSDISMGRKVDPKFQAYVDKRAKMLELKQKQAAAAGAPIEKIREHYFEGVWSPESRKAFNQAMAEAAGMMQRAGIKVPDSVDGWSAAERARIKARVKEIMAEKGGSDTSGAQYLANKPLKGTEGFRKEKVFNDIMDGIEFGLEPVSNNPVDLDKIKFRELDRSIIINEFLRELESTGDVKFNSVFKKTPEGFMRIDDPYFTVYGPPEMAMEEFVDAHVYEGLLQIAKDLGIKHARPMSAGPDRLGYAERGTGRIVTQFATELSVLAHEISHQLDFKYDLWNEIVKKAEGIGKSGKVTKAASQKQRGLIMKELRALADLKWEGQQTSQYYKDYTRKKVEQLAHLLEAYIHAPGRFRDVAPNLYDAFHSFLASKPELKGFTKIKPGIALTRLDNVKQIGGFPLIGYRVVTKAVGEVINNFLSQSAYSNPYFGLPFRGWMAAANILNQTQLGVFSFFHAGFTSLEVQVSGGAVAMKDLYGILRGNRSVKHFGKSLVKMPIDMFLTPRLGKQALNEWLNPGTQSKRIQQIVEAAQLAGFGFKLEAGLRTNQISEMTKDWHSGSKLKALARTPVALIEAGAIPVMDKLVPIQKFGVFAELAGRIIDQNPGVPLEDLRPQFRAAAMRVDARLGQVRYDRLFIRRLAKNLIQALVRAPGWSGGTIAEIGGSVIDAGKFFKDWYKDGKPPQDLPDRIAYTLSLFLHTMIANALLTYLFTGDEPQGQDYWAFRTGDTDINGRQERYILPTYAKDVKAYYEDPWHVIAAKTHPMLSLMADVKRNYDYYGVKIRDKKDPLYRQAVDLASYGAHAFVPFWMRGAAKGIENIGSLREAITGSPQKILAPLVGVMPAPTAYTNSPAEKLMTEFGRERSTGQVTKEQGDTRILRSKALKLLRQGYSWDQLPEDMRIKLNDLTDRQLAAIVSDSRISAFAARFKRQSVENKLEVWKVMTPEQKAETEETYDKAIDNRMKELASNPDKLEEFTFKVIAADTQ